ncbi:MAG TPA: hypothetical protein VES42_14710 [Pilimelia sp.]|nr:hypothetical protein [Pilimelia sp.]
MTSTTPAGTPVRPPMVRALTWLLAATAAGTVVVEMLNWAYVPEGGYGLTVRTGWALLRSIGFLLLIWHVRSGRAGARPFGLILAVTTIFAVGRLVVPRSGPPAVPGLVGFAALVLLCLAVVLVLYRSAQVADYLARPQTRLVVGKGGISRREVRPRPPVSGWLLTARVASFTYSPLMLVASLVAVAAIFDGRPDAVPAVVAWFGAGIATSYAVLFTSFFLLRGAAWARGLLLGITVAVLLVDLPLCWWLLGVDGLIRDGGPLVAAALLTSYALLRARGAGAPPPAAPAGAAARAA